MVKGRGKTARTAAFSKPAPRGASPGAASGSPLPGPSGDGDPWYLGLSKADYLALGRGIPPIKTRAEFEATLERFGTVREVFERLGHLASFVGLSEEDFAEVEREYGPDAPPGEEFFMGMNAENRYRNPKAMLRAIRALQADPEVDDSSALKKYVGYRSRVEPAGLWHTLRYQVGDGDGGRGSNGYRESSYSGVLDLYYGFHGRPQSVEEVARKTGKTTASVTSKLAVHLSVQAVSAQEMFRAAAYNSGRRYLWPDEKNGARRGDS